MSSFATLSPSTTSHPAARLSRRQASLALASLPLMPTLASAHGALPVQPAAHRRLTIVLTGGMSSQETFDPKPGAAIDRRSPADAIPTSVPGVHFSAWLPRLAARAHEFTLLRAVTLGTAPATHAAGLSLLPAATVRSLSASHRSATSLPYGASRFGRLCHAAVERLDLGSAAECVHFAETVFDTLSWDLHANGAGLPIALSDYRDTLCPQLDQVLCALFDDLQARGLWSQTDIHIVTEVGRSAMFNSRGGREHASSPCCALLAGGRFAGGQVLGRTSSDGGEVVDGEQLLSNLVAHAVPA